MSNYLKSLCLVLKPSFGCGGRHVIYRIRKQDLDHYTDIYEELIANESLMFKSIVNQ